MLPATSQSMPALRSRWPASAVTVVLPFVPVIASTVSRAACHANSSMSPNTGRPCASALRTISSSSESPGLTHTASTPSSNAGEKAPACSSPAKSFFRGGSRRLSATRTLPPSRSTQRATDSPVSPSPRISTRRPARGVGAGRGSSWKAGSRII